MKLTVAAILMLSLTIVAISQISGNIKLKNLRDKWMKVSPIFLITASSVLLTDILVSGNSVSLCVMAMDIMPSAVAMCLLSSSISDVNVVKWAVPFLLLLNAAIISVHICRQLGVVGDVDDAHAVSVTSSLALLLLAFSVYGMIERINDVKSIMLHGTVWDMVSLIVDVIYVIFVFAAVIFIQLECPFMGMLLLGGVLAATGIRMLTGSKFIVWQRKERAIAEAMKVTSVAAAADVSKIDDVYKDLYERVVAYFENDKPYLDGELTINMLVKELYTNKLYISRAISQFTGRNFCQFVNYYRVVHSMGCFRDNPDLKINELASMSGFNSIVSYNMAFRLFMGENPSEWCRKERSRLIKRK